MNIVALFVVYQWTQDAATTNRPLFLHQFVRGMRRGIQESDGTMTIITPGDSIDVLVTIEVGTATNPTSRFD